MILIYTYYIPLGWCFSYGRYKSSFERTFNSFLKVLYIFPLRYLFPIESEYLLDLKWHILPTLQCSPKHHDSQNFMHTPQKHAFRDGVSPFSQCAFQYDFTHFEASCSQNDTIQNESQVLTWIISTSITITTDILCGVYLPSLTCMLKVSEYILLQLEKMSLRYTKSRRA